MRSLIIGASGGIGGALCHALQARGPVVGLSRSRDGLDVTDEASIERLLGAQEGAFDLVVVATGALQIGAAAPEKTLRALNAEAMLAQFAVNAVGPALMIKHALRLMPRGAPSRLAVLSARVGSIGDNRLGGWYSYRAANAELNQILHSAAIEAARSHPQTVLVALHPGTVATRLTEAHSGGHPTVTLKAAAAHLLAVLDGLTPADSGGFFDWQGKPVPW